MPTVMSKFLALGLSTSKVIELSTSKPADTLGLQGKIGTLIQGAEADIVLFELKEEPVTFKDVRGIPIQGNLLFKPETIIKGGQEIAAEQLS
jgi:dihydroorotase